MKKEIVSGLAIVTLSTLPAQALNFGTGNVYDRYWAGENISLPELQGDLKTPPKLFPDRPILQPIQVPETQVLQPRRVPDGRVIAKYGVPYPIIVQPEMPMPVLKYGIPYPHDELIGPGGFTAPEMKYGINVPKYGVNVPK